MRVATFAEQVNAITTVSTNEPMSLHTTFRIGGPADYYAVAKDLEQLKKLYCLAQEYEIPFFLLGSGSNILVSDLGVRGLVVENKARNFSLSVDNSASRETHCMNGLIRAESGCLLSTLARQTAKQGFEGLEWAVGIPGTLGGAVVYNAGAFGGSMSNTVRSVRVIKTNGHIKETQVSELAFGYRSSIFSKTQSTGKNNPVILEVELALNWTDTAVLQKRMVKYIEHRRRSQPHGPSAGSIFKNPPQNSAGYLIERVGLKGFRIGDAQISPVHANFIVNLGQATSVEVEKLIALAKDRVLKEFGIQMELEIAMVGERTELRGVA